MPWLKVSRDLGIENGKSNFARKLSFATLHHYSTTCVRVDWVVYTYMIKLIDRKRHSMCHFKQWHYTKPTKGNHNSIYPFFPQVLS
jgi:hypothetical protein